MLVQAELLTYGQEATIDQLLPMDDATRNHLLADAKTVFAQAEADKAAEEAERLKKEADERDERDRRQ